MKSKKVTSDIIPLRAVFGNIIINIISGKHMNNWRGALMQTIVSFVLQCL